ncbi:MAG: ATP phosphoribosyltransferase [Clostridiales bacterium]|nr:ATP phosphoribosyltransferase [Clostridiales bacterium]
MINIALPKGRMGDRVYELFASVGYRCDALQNESRKLVFADEANGVRYLLIKPQDVAVYVERGAADIGVVGKDVLLETGPDVYELLDLGLGVCALAVAAPNGYTEDPDRILRVATKYPNVARRYYAHMNRDIDVIKLNGSIELAPLLGLSDVIVDVVETGSTLRENNLSVRQTIAPSSARLIANISSYKFKRGEIDPMLFALSERKG